MTTFIVELFSRDGGDEFDDQVIIEALSEGEALEKAGKILVCRDGLAYPANVWLA